MFEDFKSLSDQSKRQWAIERVMNTNPGAPIEGHIKEAKKLLAFIEGSEAAE